MMRAPFIAAEVSGIRYRGQLYQRLRIEPFIRKDGTESSIAIWGSTCAQCFEPFECTTPAVMPRFRPARRCADCRTSCNWSKRSKPAEPLIGMQRPFAPREDAES